MAPDADAGVAPPSSDLADARARLDLAKALLAELDLAERRRELLPARDVEARLADAFANCKTKILGVPSRARQMDPALTHAQLALFEKLLREALEDLAGGAELGDGPAEASAA